MLTIGIAGGSGSGKTTVVKDLVRQLPTNSVSVISLDSYYKDRSDLSAEDKKNVNFDAPDSFEFDLLNEHLQQLSQGKPIEMPVYSYVTCTRLKETITVEPSEVTIIEGIMIFVDPDLRDNLNIKIFVDADADDRLMRIIDRDIIERGRSYNDVLEHYRKWVKPMHEMYIEPTKKYADIILPEGGKNIIGIDILLSKIKLLINEKK